MKFAIWYTLNFWEIFWNDYRESIAHPRCFFTVKPRGRWHRSYLYGYWIGRNVGLTREDRDSLWCSFWRTMYRYTHFFVG